MILSTNVAYTHFKCLKYYRHDDCPTLFFQIIKTSYQRKEGIFISALVSLGTIIGEFIIINIMIIIAMIIIIIVM